jgi:carbonic anhydrase
MTELVHVATPAEYEAAAGLFREYATWLQIDLGFQDFENELLQLKRMYARPHGGIILCRVEGDFVGCVAIRKLENNIAELKRMYVRPATQQKGLGSSLLAAAMTLSKECGYKKIRLDTLSDMLPAINLYKKNGFAEIPAYYHNPQQTAVFFEKTL